MPILWFLGAHIDGTPWSFVVSLNDPSADFTGGGTVSAIAAVSPFLLHCCFIFHSINALPRLYFFVTSSPFMPHLCSISDLILLFSISASYQLYIS